ncbi:glycosyltransferase family 4 protein [Candidatus Actinomarina sp.]|nr:glycosyltransferase family 4 protein [Candidatus Actinomarina sp.]MDB4855642.1 glycosyltransferase family 4 protein [Acidimicrobiia bacterium]
MNFFGGVQNQIDLIKASLRGEDFNVKVLSPDSPDFNIGEAIKIPFNGSIAPIKLFPKRKIIKESLKWADIIHIHEPFIPLCFWRIPVNSKTIITHHSSISIFISSIQKMLIKNERKAAKITAVSNEAAKNVVQGLNVRIVPNAIAPEEMNIDFNTSRDILFIGRNERRKNFKLYYQLSELLKNSNYSFRAITNKNIRAPNVELYLNPDDEIKNEVLKISSIYLAVNTHGESFGITILEAINAGCTAVCSDITPFKDLLGDSGVYFKNNNLEDLKQTVERLVKSDMRAIYNNQKKHIDKYSLNKVIPSWISLYTQI